MSYDCEVELDLDGVFIDRLGLDDYIDLYLKQVLIYGSTSSTWAYLDIRTEPEFSVHIVGLKMQKEKPLEFEDDLTDKFLPFKDKILEAKRNNVEIGMGQIFMKGECSYGEYGSSLGELELSLKELDLKVVFDPSSDLVKYYKSRIDSEVQSDAERRFDPDRRYEHYHYF